MNARPVVDGLQQQYANRVRIVRVDIMTPAGRDLGERYGFQFTPFFVGLAKNKIIWQQRGLVPTSEQLDQLIAN